MSKPTIITNNVPRPVLYGADVIKVRDEYDWMDDQEFYAAEFFRYKGRVYSLDEFTATGAFPGFDGNYADSFFSGVLVRVVYDGESVVVGRYYA